MIYFMNYLTCFGFLPFFLAGLGGLLLGWWLKNRMGGGHGGDLSIEGEGALRAEADELRAKVRGLEGKLAAVGTGAAVATAAAVAPKASATATASASDEDLYALEWRNRYLAARVKYLDGRLAEMGAGAAKAGGAGVAAAGLAGASLAATRKKPAVRKVKVNKAKKPVVKKRVAVKPVKAKATTKKTTVKKTTVKKAVAKKPAAKKPAAKKKTTTKAKAAPKVKVLYTDGPTDGKPDDLKLIKGIGPKFEKDLNNKGIYYFRQIGAWKAKDVTMVEGIIDSIPGRIKRDEWVKQGKALATGAAPRAMKGKPAKTGTKAEQRFAKYYPNVKKFDSKANQTVVKNIIKYCGPALNTRDAALVACSDEAEVSRVAKGFITKKLGLKSGQLELAQDVCKTMKPQRFKDRVTFYYLAAQKAGKLSLFK